VAGSFRPPFLHPESSPRVLANEIENAARAPSLTKMFLWEHTSTFVYVKVY